MIDRDVAQLAPDVRSIDEIVTRLSRTVLNGQQPDVRHFAGVGLGDLDVVRYFYSAETVDVRPRAIRDPWVLLGQPSDTAIRVTSADGRSVVVAPGQTFLLQLSHAYRLQSAADGQLTAVMLPSSALCELPGFVRAVSASVLIGSTLNAPTWSFLNSLIDQPLPWPPMAAYFAETLITEMLSSIVLTDEPRGAAHAGRSLVKRTRNHIAAFARDPRLSTRTIAESLGTSVRSLQRAFAEAGLSLGVEMRRARVHAAITVLRSPESSFMTLDQVAQNVGYVDAIAMRRAFQAAGVGQPRTFRHPEDIENHTIGRRHA